MTAVQIDALGTKSIEVAMSSAAAFVRQRKATLDDEQFERLMLALKRRIKEGLDRGLADAAEAIECGMVSVAVDTFSAEMALAGIRAAKDVLSIE